MGFAFDYDRRRNWHGGHILPRFWAAFRWALFSQLGEH